MYTKEYIYIYKGFAPAAGPLETWRLEAWGLEAGAREGHPQDRRQEAAKAAKPS